MTIFTDGLRGGPQFGIGEMDASLGEYLGAVADETMAANPVASLFRLGELGYAEHFDPGPQVPIEEARARVKQDGLDGALTLPEDGSIGQNALDIMLERARTRRERAATIARGPSGVVAGALDVGTSLFVSALDPINVAAAFIPVIGEARYGKLMASAGEGLLARAGARAGVGAAAGAVGMTAIEPLDYLARTQEGQDYTFADALHTVMTGAALGGVLHAGGGLAADLLRGAKGKPLYPFAPGEPFAARPGGEPAPGARALPLPEAELAPGPGERMGGPPIENAPEIPPGQAQLAALDDLPPRAKEDLLRGAIARLTEGEPVAAGEMLQAAAKADPRIAASFEVFHGSPHDFEAFDLGRIGTGEGAQSFGHGLYFAESARVAGSYSRSTAERAFVNKAAELYDEFTSPGEAHQAVAQSNDFTAAQKRLLFALEKDDWLGFDYPHQAVSAVLREPGSFELSPETSVAARAIGNRYQVRIHAGKEHFLDWDKPLSEQSAQVKGALAAFDIPQKATGAEIYNRVTEAVTRGGFYDAANGGRTEGSAALREAGIPGIKYLDQQSRNAGGWHITPPEHTTSGKWMVKSSDYNSKGLHFDTEAEAKAALAEKISGQTRNYVLFDEKLAEITHKNDEPVPTWRDLSQHPSNLDDAASLDASRAAAALPEPASLAAEPSARTRAAQAAADLAEQDYRANEAFLPEDLRRRVESDVKELGLAESDARHVLEQGAACLAAAAGAVA